MSLQSEEDALSISSITNELNPLAKGDTKETLLKFITRVSKKKETLSVGVQTTTEDSLVAHNYQQLHAVSAKLISEGLSSEGVLSRDQIQVHCGDAVLALHSARDVITKVTCRRVLVLDEDLEVKPREFPLSKWRSRGSESSDAHQIYARIELNPAEPPILRSSTMVDKTQIVDDVTSDDITTSLESLQMNCEVEASSLIASLRDRSLEGLAVFFEPDPTLASIPITLKCTVRDCQVELQVGAAQQTVHVQGVRIKLNQDESWEIGHDLIDICELERLRTENEVLREKLRLLSIQFNCSPDG